MKAIRSSTILDWKEKDIDGSGALAVFRVLSGAFKGHLGMLVVAVIVLSSPSQVVAAELRIGGTGNALGTMRLLAAAYENEHADTRINVLDSIGTSGALKAVPKGALDIGLSSRPLTDEEIRSGLTATEYARCATVFAVQIKNPAVTISISELADIYSGKMQEWPDGTPIRPVLRQPGDDNYRQAGELSSAVKQALLDAEKRPGLPFAVTDQESADKAESIPGSFSITTSALIISEKRKLKALSLGGVEPNLENIASSRYPMIKRFYFIFSKAPPPAVQSFINFVASPTGRDILRQTGHLVP